MPKIKYYDDVKIIKKPIKKRFFRFLSFFCIVVVFSICIVVSGLLSEALTVGNVFGNFIYGDSNIKIKEKNYFAVVLGEYDDYKEAESVALGSTIQGASGFIWEDTKYYVVGSMYSSIDDANLVIDNLKDSNYSTSVKTITIPEINITLGDYENKDVRKIEECFKYIDSLYDTIYSYSIDFDKKLLNNLAISTYLSDLRGECKVYISQIQNYLNTPSEDLQKIQNALIKLDQLLNDVIIKTIDNTATGYILKNTIVSIIKIKYDLYSSLQ